MRRLLAVTVDVVGTFALIGAVILLLAPTGWLAVQAWHLFRLDTTTAAVEAVAPLCTMERSGARSNTIRREVPCADVADIKAGNLDIVWEVRERTAVVLAFTDANGAPQRLWRDPAPFLDGARVGAEVPIRYDPADPNRIGPPLRAVDILLAVLVMASATLFGAAWWGLRRLGERLAESLELEAAAQAAPEPAKPDPEDERRRREEKAVRRVMATFKPRPPPETVSAKPIVRHRQKPRDDAERDKLRALVRAKVKRPEKA